MSEKGNCCCSAEVLEELRKIREILNDIHTTMKTTAEIEQDARTAQIEGKLHREPPL